MFAAGSFLHLFAGTRSVLIPVPNASPFNMHLLSFVILNISTICFVISSEICDYVIKEDGLPVNSDVSTGSPSILKQLAESEEIVHAFIQRDYFYFQDNLTYCQRHLMEEYLLHFESSTGKLTHRYKLSGQQVSSRAYNVAWNPIATMLMMRRFHSYLVPLVASLNDTSHQGLFSTITHTMSRSGWPSATSLNASIDAVLRIQQVHDLTSADVAKGVLDNESTGLSISPEEIVIIAERALDQRIYVLAIDWFEQALTDFSVNNPQREIVVQRLQHTIYLHDSNWESSFSLSELQANFYTTKVDNVLAEKRIRGRTQMLQNLRTGTFSDPRIEAYWGLCSGKTYQTEEEKSRLFCYYESRKHPFLTIAPIKAEVLAYDETVVLQFYDILDDGTIAKLKMEASTRLELSKIEIIGQGNQTGTMEISLTQRSSLGVFIPDNFRDDIKLGRIVESATGLKVRKSWTASEDLQVAAYASGSHNVMHLDSGRDSDRGPITDWNYGTPVRLATFLFYLSDVIKGGGTSFMQGRVLASPVKGSALLWFNLMKSADTDYSSWHGACPVIIGEKWIANKWIRYADQVFQPGCKCDTDPKSKFTLNDVVSYGRQEA